MPSTEQIDKLKSGSEVWNEWRIKNFVSVPLLDGVDLSESDLSGANLEAADLRDAKLDHCNLSRASLVDANLSRASIRMADLSDTNLRGANLQDADLAGSQLNGATLGDTIFAKIDLSTIRGLDTCIHKGPSSIDLTTLISGRSPLERAFLLACGLPMSVIDALPSFASTPVPYFSCFLSYAKADEKFAQRLHNDLQSLGIRVWFAPHELRVGDNLRKQIDHSLSHADKIVLVLSQASAKSDWVRWEMEKAYELERETNRNVLIPVSLDDSVFTSKEPWIAQIRNRLIFDFSNWRQKDAYQKSVGRFAKDLALTLASENEEL